MHFVLFYWVGVYNCTILYPVMQCLRCTAQQPAATVGKVNEPNQDGPDPRPVTLEFHLTDDYRPIPDACFLCLDNRSDAGEPSKQKSLR